MTAASWPTPGPTSSRASVFDVDIQRSERGEYEITDYVSALAVRQPVSVVQASFWLPIGTVKIWEQAQNMELEGQLQPRA